MKKIIISLFFVFLLISSAGAKTIEQVLYERSNVKVPGYNITLLLVGSNEKSIVVCVNNEKRIINKDSGLLLENLRIEPLRIYPDNAKLKITYSCEECICDESCSNSLCFAQTIQEQKNETKAEEQNITKQQETKQVKDNITAISIFLFLIVLILLIVLLFRKKRKKR